MPEGFSQLPRGIFGGVQVQAADTSPNLLVREAQVTLGTIPTTGSVELLMFAPCAGTLVNFRVASSDGIAANDTNYITFQAVNKSNGNAVMATVTTQLTGGNAIGSYNGSLSWVPSATPANLVVALNDVIAITATVTGTLGAAVHEVAVVARLNAS